MKNIGLVRAAGYYFSFIFLLLFAEGALAQIPGDTIPKKQVPLLSVSLKSQFPIQQAIGLEVMTKTKLSGYLGFGQFSRFYTTVALNALPNKKVEQQMRRRFIKDNLRNGTVFEAGLTYHLPRRRKFYAGINFQNQNFTLPSTTQQLVENYDFLDSQDRKDKIMDLIDKNARLREFYETAEIISKVSLQRLGITIGRRFGFMKIPRFGLHTELSGQWNMGSRTSIESSSLIGNVLVNQFAEPILREKTKDSFSSFFLPSLTLKVSYALVTR
ncbi:hypothetical protein J2Y45_006710 [Dyadobacter sp. BE34]|uniref:DUF5723 domain-containing protein n=1 Tax=Dyadobacter fermentans TaxID=94254 RepID=A0ABU1R8A1_9BACT|nr:MULTISPECIES: hypothetical protein [Dyadobacter]MDR6809632.1 hypothetical protein [Dyadobacter fermentans]MDR7047310.1 hypothetical protein [Dyadobacter sp. BE242]MDR7201546.1 hypothetical protein [Dyadobacter sp. BE34]MDR7219416.1 hypothetical protein [Dyadobacter sp. BE31]MDR7267190.1 hypothetical protein [Dyadobacter sp. BE32]